MRICRECKIEKELNRDNFHYKSSKRGTFRTICIPCWSIYHRQHYLANKESYISNSKKITESLVQSNTEKLLQYFKTHPCVDCEEKDPVVLEFDHVRDEKAFNIGEKVRKSSWAVIEKEIQKCDVRCANCHRRKTAKQRGYQRFIQTDS